MLPSFPYWPPHSQWIVRGLFLSFELLPQCVLVRIQMIKFRRHIFSIHYFQRTIQIQPWKNKPKTLEERYNKCPTQKISEHFVNSWHQYRITYWTFVFKMYFVIHTAASLSRSSSFAPRDTNPISWENCAKLASPNKGIWPKISWTQSLLNRNQVLKKQIFNLNRK